jgi:predicted glycosyltransferase
MRVLFYVQNLLGIGHILRALRIARALAAGGAEVRLVLGGRPLAGFDHGGIEIVQLPPISSGPKGFTDLVGEDGRALDAAAKTARKGALLAAFAAARPDVLAIEAFPFGRRQMRFELIPLLEAAHAARPRPLIVCSIRDILQETRKPERAEETVRLLLERFDHVVVHGDPRIATLADTFPLAGRIEAMLSYSGIVGPPAAAEPCAGERYDVVVSAGGGAVGARVLGPAIEAKTTTSLARARWLAVTGPNLPAADAARIERLAAAADVTLARFVPDLPGLLRQARLSVSQAGYNTIADVLSAGCRSVVVPFAEGGETEQSHRAAALESRGLAVVVPEHGLTASGMARAIDRASATPPGIAAIDLDGARRTAAIVTELLARHRERHQ